MRVGGGGRWREVLSGDMSGVPSEGRNVRV